MSAFMRTLAVLLPVVVLWGCSGTGGTKDGADDANGTDKSPVTMPEDENGKVNLQPVSPVQPIPGQPIDPNSQIDAETKALLAQNTVYFDFDKSEIKPEARKIIEAHAKRLAQNPSMRVTLEGHCDERGTREYNLGLGERRSKAVQRVMSLMGVSANQMTLVSYGEERPVDMGHNERAWAKNRRVEFVYR